MIALTWATVTRAVGVVAAYLAFVWFVGRVFWVAGRYDRDRLRPEDEEETPHD